MERLRDVFVYNSTTIMMLLYAMRMWYQCTSSGEEGTATGRPADGGMFLYYNPATTSN